MSGRGYLVVEGRGEIRAAQNLVIRLWADLALTPLHWAEPIRGRALHTQAGLIQACSLVRTKRDVELLLILRDADDDGDCPKMAAPQAAGWMAGLCMPFPTAITLLRREYETLFLPCLSRMAGVPLRDDRGIERPGLQPGCVYHGDYEARRGVKEWLTAHFPAGRSYKPTLDQLPMTRLIDFDLLRQSGLPSFGTLERALRFLDASRGQSLLVYPVAAK